MNKKSFFIGLCVFFNVSGSTYVTKEAEHLDPIIGEVLVAYCHSELPGPEDVDNTSIFVGGKYWKTIKEVKEWNLQKELRENRMKILAAHSKFFQQLQSTDGVVCLVESPNPKETKRAIVVGTTDCNKCEVVRQYYEELQKINHRKLWGFF